MVKKVDPRPFLEREDTLLELIFSTLRETTVDRKGLERVVRTLQTPIDSERLAETFELKSGFETEDGDFVTFDNRKLFADGKPTLELEKIFAAKIMCREGVQERTAYLIGRLVHESVFMLGMRFVMRKQTALIDALAEKHEVVDAEHLMQIGTYLTQVSSYLGRQYARILTLSLFSGSFEKLYYQVDQVWQNLRTKQKPPGPMRLRNITDDPSICSTNLGYDDALFRQILDEYCFLSDNVDVLNGNDLEQTPQAQQMWLGLSKLYESIGRLRGTKIRERVAKVREIFAEHSQMFKGEIVRALECERLPERTIYLNFPDLKSHGDTFQRSEVNQ